MRYYELHEGDDSAEEEEAEEGETGAAGGDGGGGGKAAGKKAKDKDEWPPLYECAEALESMRPVPPPLSDGGGGSDPARHAAWARTLKVGGAADLKYDGGWWRVEVLRVWDLGPGGGPGGGAVGQPSKESKEEVEVDVEMEDDEIPDGAAASGAAAAPSAGADAASAGGGSGGSGGSGGLRFTVRACDFDVEHVVGADLLRPPYAWNRETGVWSLRAPPSASAPTPKKAPPPRRSAGAAAAADGRRALRQGVAV